jgi:hypothetical protein
MPPDMVDKPKGLPINSPGYETKDANVGGAFNFLVILSAILLSTALLCWGLFRFLSSQDTAGRNVSPFAETRQLPPSPQLQVNPRQEWVKYHEEQEHSLETYAWEDKTAGTVRVPIEQAMEILVKKGMPVQGEPVPAEKTPPTAAKESKKP